MSEEIIEEEIDTTSYDVQFLTEIGIDLSIKYCKYCYTNVYLLSKCVGPNTEGVRHFDILESDSESEEII